MNRLAAALALAGLVAAGCSLGATNLPTHRDLADGPTARITGTLGDTRGCVFLPKADGSWMILVWPMGFRLDQGFILDAQGVPVAGIDQPVTLAGGANDDTQYASCGHLCLTSFPRPVARAATGS